MARALLPLLILAVAACGPLPRPFQPDDKRIVEAQEPAEGTDRADGVDILVLPLGGDAPGNAEGAAETLADGLRDLGVRASAEGNTARRVLTGTAQVEASGEDREAVLITWEISRPNGEGLVSFEQRNDLPSGLWKSGQAGAVSSVMTDAARALAARVRTPRSLEVAAPPEEVEAPLAGAPPVPVSRRRVARLATNSAGTAAKPMPEDKGPAPESAETQQLRALLEKRRSGGSELAGATMPDPPADPMPAEPRPYAATPTVPTPATTAAPDLGGPRLVIVPMEELPGDGEQSLSRALEIELRAANYEVTSEIGDGDLLIMAEVEVKPAEPGWEDVAITWWVVKASDGKDLGQINQGNLMPAGSLDAGWGPLAEGIARGAVDGIAQLIAESSRT